MGNCTKELCSGRHLSVDNVICVDQWIVDCSVEATPAMRGSNRAFLLRPTSRIQSCNALLSERHSKLEGSASHVT